MSQEFKFRTDPSDEPETYVSIKKRVSKIDRFASCFAIEVEERVHSRLSNILNMFLDRSSKVIHEFSMKCKSGFQRHLQDRILDQSKNPNKTHKPSLKNKPPPNYHLSDDRLFYGEGAQLIHELLIQPLPQKTNKRKRPNQDTTETMMSSPDSFEPSLYVQKIEQLIREEIRRSLLIVDKLNIVQNTLKYLARNHRDQVDSVYSAVEERQASVVIRRSAYNLSLAANQATSTPITGWPTRVPGVN
jgi:hypothetical protein